MGEVISFPARKRVIAVMGSDIQCRPVAKWNDQFWDERRWRFSQRGNPVLLIEVGDQKYRVTVFCRQGGWAWSIADAEDAAAKPLWSDGTFGSEHEARHDAWDALTTLAKMEMPA